MEYHYIKMFFKNPILVSLVQANTTSLFAKHYEKGEMIKHGIKVKDEAKIHQQTDQV